MTETGTFAIESYLKMSGKDEHLQLNKNKLIKNKTKSMSLVHIPGSMFLDGWMDGWRGVNAA